MDDSKMNDSEMSGMKGALNWVFCDGDLPPKAAGANDTNDANGANDANDANNCMLDAHEALMVVNLNEKAAGLAIDILFEDKPPMLGIKAHVDGQRIRCFRLDKPLGGEPGGGYTIPAGQYALVLHSDIPVFAVFGRLDVRSPLAYYTVQGHTY